jgi:hypothetical protein
MKYQIKIPLYLLLLSLSTTIFLMGCVSAKTAAYKTLAAVGYSVDATMVIYAKAVVKGQVSPETRAKVAFIHDKQFAPAYTAAVMAAKMDYTTLAPADVQQIAANLAALITSIVGTNSVTAP